MTEIKDQALTTLLTRLAGRDMLGFELSRQAEALALTKLGNGKVGSVKPPPSGPSVEA